MFLAAVALWLVLSPLLWLLIQTTQFKRSYWQLILEVSPLMLRGGAAVLIIATAVAGLLLVWRLLRIQFGVSRSG